MHKLLPALLVCLIVAFDTSAQSTDSLLIELLNTPSPPSRNNPQPELSNGAKRRPANFFDEANPPADDAPIEDIRDYWKEIGERASYNEDRPKMTDAVAGRLLERISDEPAALASYLKVFPINEKVGRDVAEAFSKLSNAEEVTDSWTKSVRGWLKLNTPVFIDELEADARTTRDHKSYGSVVNEEELGALARIDWERAKPIIERLAADSVNKRAATLAIVLLYEHAISEKETSTVEALRTQLRKIVEDKNAPGRARNSAAEALFAAPWPGQDDWYLSLFEDDSLRNASDGNTLYSPIEFLAEKSPAKWIPHLVRLLESENQSVRNSAVACLMEIETKESLQPLIRWLSDPDWAHSGGRTTLMQIVSKFELRESIPGLIWIVDNEEESVHWAARTLGAFRDPIAVPTLRRALFDRSKSENERKALIKALIECGGLTVPEQIESLELFAELSINADGLQKLQDRSEYEDENPPPVLLSIGKYLSEVDAVSDELVAGLIARQKVLVRENPRVAKVLSELMSRWKGKLVDMALLATVEDGTADSNTIIGLLTRREELRENVPNYIHAMLGLPGLPGGIAPCLTEDDGDLNSAFRSDDTEKKISVMACSRLLLLPLPIDHAETLLKGSNKSLSIAAERYLESVNSPDTRKLIFARHPNEVLILGPRISFNPANRSTEIHYKSSLYKLFQTVGTAFSFSEEFSNLDDAENRLRNELKNDAGLIQVYAHLPNHESGQRIVRIYKTHATFSYEIDKARYLEKVIPNKELEAFLRVMKEIDLDNRASAPVSCHYDCYSREFVSISRNGGHRIYNGSRIFAMGALDFIENFFDREALVMRYRSKRHLPGLQVVYSGSERLLWKGVAPALLWKELGDFRVLIRDEDLRDAISNDIEKLDEVDDKNEELDDKERDSRSRKRRIDRGFEHYRWLRFSGDKLTDSVVSEPDSMPFLKMHTSFPSSDEFKENLSIWKALWNGYQIQIGEGGGDVGLWRTNKNEQVKIADGSYYGQPVLAGDWVVIATNDSNWEKPKHLVSINLRTGRQRKINLPPTVGIEPIAFVAAHKRILVSDGNENSESYYLIEPGSGEMKKVTGEFAPLRSQYLRPLQPTDKQDEVWATLVRKKKNETEIGIYNTRTFTFRPLMLLPEIALTPDQTWVDAHESRAYFIYSDDFGQRSDILTVPLPKAKETKP